MIDLTFLLTSKWLMKRLDPMSLRFGRRSWYRGGMVLLLFVVAKIFLIDMNGLEGLLRVASFLGLGICLLGLSLLHQKMPRTVAEA